MGGLIGVIIASVILLVWICTEESESSAEAIIKKAKKEQKRLMRELKKSLEK